MRAAGITGAASGLIGTAATPLALSSCAAAPTPRDVEPVRELAAFLIDSEPEALLRGVVDRIEGGMSALRIAAATAVASARAFTPIVPDANLHVLYATDAAFSLGTDAPFRETFEVLAWNAHRFKTAQLFPGDDEPPAYALLLDNDLPNAREAAATLDEACAERDGAAAERAATALLRAGRTSTLVETLARSAAAEDSFAVHKIIHVRHFASSLELFRDVVGSENVELLARCCARSVASPADDRVQHARTVARVAELDAAALLAGRERDDAVIAPLLAVLRTPDADAVAQAIVDVLAAGVHVDMVWDALLVAAADQMASGNFGAGRHHVTGSAAHRITSSWLTDDASRLVHVLQAAALFAPEAGGDATFGIDVLEPIATSTVEEAVNALPFDTFAFGEPTAAQRALGFFEEGGAGAVDALLEAWRQRVFQYTDVDFHEVKMLHTVKREAARITPAWRERFVACAFLHAPPAVRSEWPGYGDVKRALNGTSGT